MKPLVSIIMPAYNAAAYINEAICSILYQSFKDFEFIIIDDSSTDSTSAILNNWQKKDRRIKIITNRSNLGVSRSLNQGIKQARTKYIARQDADDLSYPDRIKLQVNFLEHHPRIKLLGTNAVEINPHGRFLQNLTFPTRPSQIKALSLDRNCFVHGSIMADTSVIKNLGGYPTRKQFLPVEIEDFELWALLTRKYQATNLPKYLYKLRANPESVGRKHRQRQQEILNQVKIQQKKRYGYQHPKVSVIIPTHNRHCHVATAINSVLLQTEDDIEVIVVNDGSIDETEETLNNLSSQNKQLFTITTSNQGVANARNTGIRWSRGEYIAFLDDDDSWQPTKIAKQLNRFNTSRYEEKLGLVYCFHYWINQNGRKIGKNKISYRGNVFSQIIKENMICGSGSAAMVKKECFEKLGNFNTKLTLAEDWEMWLRIARHYQVDYVPEYLVNITRHTERSKYYNFLIFYNHLKIYWLIAKIILKTPTFIPFSNVFLAAIIRIKKDIFVIIKEIIHLLK